MKDGIQMLQIQNNVLNVKQLINVTHVHEQNEDVHNVKHPMDPMLMEIVVHVHHHNFGKMVFVKRI